jgi:hypothetical protein
MRERQGKTPRLWLGDARKTRKLRSRKVVDSLLDIRAGVRGTQAPKILVLALGTAESIQKFYRCVPSFCRIFFQRQIIDRRKSWCSSS